MEGTIAEIRYFAGVFAPRNWFRCEGQLLSISQYTAFFSLLGTSYGGDGRTTFAIPDLRGRVIIGPGTGPGLSTRQIGQKSGQEAVTLSQAEMPSHTHTASTPVARTGGASAVDPVAGLLPGASIDINGDDVKLYTADGTDIQSVTTVGNTGIGQAHTNMQPWLCMIPIICHTGIYPSRS